MLQISEADRESGDRQESRISSAYYPKASAISCFSALAKAAATKHSSIARSPKGLPGGQKSLNGRLTSAHILLFHRAGPVQISVAPTFITLSVIEPVPCRVRRPPPAFRTEYL